MDPGYPNHVKIDERLDGAWKSLFNSTDHVSLKKLRALVGPAYMLASACCKLDCFSHYARQQLIFYNYELIGAKSPAEREDDARPNPVGQGMAGEGGQTGGQRYCRLNNNRGCFHPEHRK